MFSLFGGHFEHGGFAGVLVGNSAGFQLSFEFWCWENGDFFVGNVAAELLLQRAILDFICDYCCDGEFTSLLFCKPEIGIELPGAARPVGVDEAVGVGKEVAIGPGGGGHGAASCQIRWAST